MRKAAFLAFFAVLIVLACLFLSACHGRAVSSEFQLPDHLDTSQKIELTFWAKNDTNKAQTNVYKHAIEEFQKLYPNITVNLRLYTDYGKIYNDVITNISTNSTPNVCITYPDHIATYLTGENTVACLDDLMKDPKYGLGGSELLFDSPGTEEVIPAFLSECMIQDHYYALPYMRSTEACYVNKTYVEKLGYTLPEMLTWDFVWEVSEKAAQKDLDGTFVVNGQEVMLPFIYKSTDNMMISILKQLDAGYSTDDGQILIFNDTTRQILEDLAQHVKNGAFSTFKISGYPANFLNAGQCIFAIDSTAGSTWMGADAPLSDISEDAFVEFETAVLPIPQFDPDDPWMISQGPSICIFQKSDPQVVLASWLFAQYMLTNDVQIAYAQTEGYVPVTSKAQDSEEYQTYLALEGTDDRLHYQIKIDAAKLLLDNTDHTFVTPVFNGSTSLRNAAGELVENVTKSVRRRKTVDDAFIDALFSDVTSLYRLDQIQGLAGETDDGDENADKNLGPLPAGSKWLLILLAGTWAVLLAGLVTRVIKKKRAGSGE